MMRGRRSAATLLNAQSATARTAAGALYGMYRGCSPSGWPGLARAVLGYESLQVAVVVLVGSGGRAVAWRAA
jgi:hypothetical protein